MKQRRTKAQYKAKREQLKRAYSDQKRAEKLRKRLSGIETRTIELCSNPVCAKCERRLAETGRLTCRMCRLAIEEFERQQMEQLRREAEVREQVELESLPDSWSNRWRI